jgi:hypothetical protein
LYEFLEALDEKHRPPSSLFELEGMTAGKSLDLTWTTEPNVWVRAVPRAARVVAGFCPRERGRGCNESVIIERARRWST